MGLDFKGQEEFAQRLRSAGRGAAECAQSAVHVEAELIATESMRRTPVEHGTLRGSTVVRSDGALGNTFQPMGDGYAPADLSKHPDATRTNPVAQIGVGGAAEEYGVYVHERLDVAHEVGEAKFLENAVNKAIPGMDRRLQDRIAACMARRVR